MQRQELERLLAAMPKAENHVHLEGSIHPNMLLRLAKKNKVTLPFDNEADAARYIKTNTQSLDTFINVFNLVNAVLLEADDFYDLLLDFAKKSIQDNIIYQEIMVNFAVHEARGLSADDIVEALARATKEAKDRYGIQLYFTAELDRSKDAAYALDLVNRMVNYRKKLPLIALGWALGLKGKEEDNYGPMEHQAAFTLAREKGFYTTAHCGEAQGPESVHQVLRYLKPDRIDHGVQAAKDPALLKKLAKEDILLAVCPTTNIMIGLYEDLAHHPLSTLLSYGVPVSISTDDPAYLLTPLSQEIADISLAQNLDEKTLVELLRNAFIYSFAGKDLLPVLDDYLAKNLAKNLA